MSTRGEKHSFSIGHPFALDVNGEEKLGVWRMIDYLGMLGFLGEKLGISTNVFTSGGDQTPKWLPSSPKGEIFGIMTNVLSLIVTYLINMST